MKFFNLLLALTFFTSSAMQAKAEPVPLKIQFEQVNSDYINFTLLNKTLKSIPLWIPNYMNPNLSPMSSSGITLKIGQEIYFKYRRKKRVLITVTADLKGKKIAVKKLIEEREAELSKK